MHKFNTFGREAWTGRGRSGKETSETYPDIGQVDDDSDRRAAT